MAYPSRSDGFKLKVNFGGKVLMRVYKYGRHPKTRRPIQSSDSNHRSAVYIIYNIIIIIITVYTVYPTLLVHMYILYKRCLFNNTI